MEQLSNIELFKIISQQWATTKDICALACCKETKASAIKKEIATQILNEGKAIPNSRVIPMSGLIKYLSIDKERNVKNEKLEAEILK